MPEKPLYVRLPSQEAARLDAAAAQLHTSKRELVTRLVVEKLDDVLVGHADFRPYPPADVLDVAQAAELLQVADAAVLELAESGELPGRRVGGEWRLARAAVLAWLGGAPTRCGSSPSAARSSWAGASSRPRSPPVTRSPSSIAAAPILTCSATPSTSWATAPPTWAGSPDAASTPSTTRRATRPTSSSSRS